MPLALGRSRALYVPDVVSPARVLRLATMCLCGRDRGDHLVESPHALPPELGGEIACPGFRRAPSRASALAGGAGR